MTHLQPNVRDVFEEAIERKIPQERFAYLGEACAGCPEVRARVELLLGAHDEAGTFLAEATNEPFTLAPNDAAQGESGADIPVHEGPRNTIAQGHAVGPEDPLPTIPGYHLLDVLGRGGMGVVYKARQIGLNRLVALKMILTGAHAGAEHRRRFLTEAEAVASLRHPNIVQIHEIGEHDGQPYFSLEYCAGGNLAGKLNGMPLPALEAAQIVRTLAQAVQAAHQAGVIHRDLKPANVLIQESGVRNPASEKPGHDLPDSFPLTPDSCLKITDFGLAKKLDEAGQTASGAVMGTPSYMAPEQAGGSKETGPAADIYALGTILYECLTGRPPFRAATSLETIVMVVGNEPVPPTRLAAKVPRDLETICLKCLQKAPGNRYRSAADLAVDLGRFLKGEPIQARPVSRVERTWRWCRRKPLVASLLALIALVALTGAGAVLHQLDRAVTAEGNLQGQAVDLRTALGEKTEAEKKVRKKATDLEEANKELDKAYKELDKSSKELKAALQEVKKQKEAVERRMYSGNIALAQAAWQDYDLPLALRHMKNCRQEFRGWEYDYLWTLFANQPSTFQAGGMALCVAYSPNQKWIVSSNYKTFTGENGPFLKVWGSSNGKEIHSINVGSPVATIAFSPDSKQFVSGSSDKTMKLWDVLTGKEVRSFTGHSDLVVCVAFSPDGKQILSFSKDGILRVWDPLTGHGRIVKKLNVEIVPLAAAFSQDGKQLVASVTKINPNHTVIVWDTASGEKLRTFKGQGLSVWKLAFSPDGKRIVSSALDQHGPTAIVWDVATGDIIVTFKGHTRKLGGVAFSPDGKQIVSGGVDGKLKLWDASTGQELLTLEGHLDRANCVAFSPDGKQIVSGSDDATLKLWDAVNGQKTPTFRNGFAYSYDGKLAVSGVVGAQVRDAASGKVIATFRGHGGGKYVLGAAFSPDNKWIVSADQEGNAKVWNASTGQEVSRFKASSRYGVNTRVTAYNFEFSPDSKWIIASDGKDNSVKIWDRDSGREIHTLAGNKERITAIAFSPDGKRIVTGQRDPDGTGPVTLKVWDAVTGQEIRCFKGHKGQVLSVAFSPDGKRIVTGAVAFSPDGKRIVTGGYAYVWDAENGQEILALLGHTEGVRCVAFSPDGKRIVSGSNDRTVRVWDAESGLETITLKGYTGEVVNVNFSADGRRIFGSTFEGELKVWDASAGPGAK